MIRGNFLIEGNILTPLALRTSRSFYFLKILGDIELNTLNLEQWLFWGDQYKKWNIKMIFMNLQQKKLR